MPKNRLDIIFEDAQDILKRVDFSWLEGKTVLVTGATGLLGTHFLATLALLKEHGTNIQVSGHCHSEPADYTKEIAKKGSFFLEPAYGPPYYDAIIHASGYAQPSVFTVNPAETISINTTLTQKLFKTFLLPRGKFLFVSSSEVYSGLFDRVDEFDIGTTGPNHPRACYIEGKRCGEAIVNAYRQAGVDAKSARLGLTYGPGTRQNDQRAMSGFIRQALEDKHVRMLYPGREPRSFCYVRDAVEMMWNVLLHGTKPVYNVGSPFVTNMKNVASTIAYITESDLSLPAQSNELPGSGDVRMDVSLIESEFGAPNYVSLEEGLRRTVDWNKGFYGSV